jgi:hypothetical protein
MPDIFKALATIMAWILWIVALVMGFGTFIRAMITLGPRDVTPMVYPGTWAVAGFYAIAAVVIMILRKKME